MINETYLMNSLDTFESVLNQMIADTDDSIRILMLGSYLSMVPTFRNLIERSKECDTVVNADGGYQGC